VFLHLPFPQAVTTLLQNSNTATVCSHIPAHFNLCLLILKCDLTKISHVINKGAANPRTLFKTIDNLLKSQKKTVCPSDEMCNNFNKYFTEKFRNIYSSISSDSPLLICESYSKNSLSTALSNFATVNVDNVFKLIMIMSSSTCSRLLAY